MFGFALVFSFLMMSGLLTQLTYQLQLGKLVHSESCTLHQLSHTSRWGLC